MNIGERVKNLREFRKLSQGEIETRTGLLRCYVSRVENGHTVPSIETLEKLARALEVKLHELLYEVDAQKKGFGPGWGSTGKNLRTLKKLSKNLSMMTDGDRLVLMSFCQSLVRKKLGAGARRESKSVQ